MGLELRNLVVMITGASKGYEQLPRTWTKLDTH